MDTPLNVTLRAPEPADVDLIYIWDNDQADCHTSLSTGMLSRHQIEKYVAEYDGDIFRMGGLRFMIDVEAETVGTVDIFDFDRRGRHAFVGIFVSPRFRGNGIGRQALDEVARFVRSNLSMHSLAALVAVDNAASRTLFASAGYAETGRLKGWIISDFERTDVVIFQKLL